jgi:hypothetical protein
MSAQLDLDDVVVGSKSELAINELAQLRNEKENVENLLIKSHNQYADLYADNAQLRNRIKELENEKFIHCGVPLGYHPEEDVTEWCDKPAATGICGDHWNEFIEQKKRIAELEARTTWQPIETIPTDTLWKIVSDGKIVFPAYYEGGWKDSDNEYIYERLAIKLTHWMPLPEPPK